jgi:hypothetical protein
VLVSPLVLPADVLGLLDDWPPTDFREALTALRGVSPVELVDAPASARRVSTSADLTRLEALSRG